MSFGFGSGFGQQQQQQPFGSAPSQFGQSASPFGQGFGASTPAFGAPSSTPAFGAPASAAAFGAPTSAPAFGAPASTPAFGASTPAFGGTSFGAKPGGFGFGNTAPASPFGSSMPAFGAASSPAFGAAPSSTPAFGGPSPFGGGFAASTPAFGAASTPAFGAASAPAFGAASTPAFGAASAPAFGAPAAAPAFGATTFGASPFGGAPAAVQGTRAVPYQKHQEQDQNTSGSKTVVFFMSITAMPAYQSKSVEELRWEDYQVGATAGTTAAPPQVGGMFSQPQSSSPFGTTSPSPFGATSPSPAFGAASTPMFGATTFGAQSQSGFTFGSAPAFGQQSTPGFGTPGSMPTFGGVQNASPFGAAPTTSNPFGGSPTPFGGTPTFGATTTPTGVFGGQPATSPFGASTSAAPFSFNPQSTPAFGTMTAPAFGATTPPLFGGYSTPAFGQSSAGFTFQTSTPAFGAPSQASPFGGTAPSFAAPTPGFNPIGQQRPPTFGATQPSLFGSSMPSFNFNSSPAGGLFGAASTPSFATGGALGVMQQPGQQPFVGAQQLLQLPGIASYPYGVLPEQPKLPTQVPEYKVGLSSRPVGKALASSPRPTTLIAPRSITPTSGLSIRARRSTAAARQLARSPADFFGSNSQRGELPKSPLANGNIFAARDNPTRLFIRHPLPSTDGAGTTSSVMPSTSRGAPPAEGTRGNDVDEARNGRDAPDHGDDAGWNTQRDEDERDTTLYGQQTGTISNKQLSDWLPVMTQPGYYCDPTLRQLAAMARENPAELSRVSNFCIGRKGYGTVRFLEPVDLRGLRLDDIVKFENGAVEVYVDGPHKPEVGDGLNKPAVITLHKIFRMDKATNKPTTDPVAIEKFRNKLKAAAAKQAAKFISYDPQEGTWVFEVEHFSRYGLNSLDSDEGEQEEEDDVSQQESGFELSVGRALEGVDDMVEGDDIQSRGRSKGTGSQRLGIDGSQNVDSDWDNEGSSCDDTNMPDDAPLQVSLAAHLDIDPVAAAGLKEGLYGAGDQPSATATALALPHSMAWRQQQRAGESSQRGSHAPIGPIDGMQSGVLAGFDAIIVPAALPSQPTTPTDSQQVNLAGDLTGRGSSLVDAGIMLGQSFRAGWGSHGIIAAPAAVSHDSVPSINIVLRLPLANAVQPPGRAIAPVSPHGPLLLGPAHAAPRPVAPAVPESEANAWRRALEIHLEHSRPTSSSSGGSGGVPGWAFCCQDERELEDVATKYIKSHTEYLQTSGVAASAVQKVCMQHAGHTWDLMRVLFSHRLPPNTTGAHTMEDTEDGSVEDDDRVDDGASGPPSRLTVMRVKAGLSHWLMDRAKPVVEAQLGQANSHGHPWVMLQLLSGFQLSGAACIAAAAGDVRLASLIAQGPRSTALIETMKRQRAVWTAAGFNGLIDADRLLVYQLLSGEVDAVVDAMRVDWRRAFGLHLWYHQPALSSITQALASYTASVKEGSSPPPVPLYAERLGLFCPPGVYDIHYYLLRLACDEPDSKLLAHLVRPQAYTPHVLDCLLGWLVWGCLTAIGLVDDTDEQYAQQVETLHLHLIAQLSTVPSLAPWCIYVALHLPPCTTPHNKLDARGRLVRELLSRHCPVWAADGDQIAFLRDKLGVPSEWLAEAQALWCKHNGDTHGELRHLILAAKWQEAQHLLAYSVGPDYIQTANLTALRQTLDQLQSRRVVPDGTAAAQLLRLYTLYAQLQEEFEQMQVLSDEGMELCGQLKLLLREVSRKYCNSTSDDFSQLQCTFSIIGADACRWLLTGGSENLGQDLVQQMLAVSLQPINQRDRLSALQMCAATLAATLA